MSTIPTTRALLMLSMSPRLKAIRNWWLHRAERHYLICADVEEKRIKEAMAHQKYYQQRAAMARSGRI